MIFDKPVNPGDLKKFVVKIDGKDVSTVVSVADIYQDIFSPTWSAQIFMDDSSNLLSTLPIKAGKKITIQIQTDFGGFEGDGEKEFEMVIYKVGDKQFVNHMHYTYTIFAAHESFFSDRNRRVQRAYNSSASGIASSVISEELKAEAEVHSSQGSIAVVIPNWTPIMTAAWCCKVGLHDGAADYCFFQSDNKKFAFKSFEKMYSSDDEKVAITFVQRPEGLREKGDAYDDFTFHVQNYEFQHFDAAAGAAAGMYKSKTVSFDLLNKKWEVKNFSYGDDCKADAKAKNFEDSIAEPDANISFLQKHEAMYDGSLSIYDTGNTWIPSRKSSIQKMDSERLLIQIPGSVKAWKWLGKNVQVDLPSQHDMEDEKLDKYRKGRYVIVAIRHNVKKSAYSLNLELIKKRMEA